VNYALSTERIITLKGAMIKAQTMEEYVLENNPDPDVIL
jgi:hypothetical protein